MKNFILYIIVVLVFFSCEKKNVENDAVARVNNSYLFKEEILSNMPDNFNREDSLLFRSNYINAWALEKLLLDKAKINIDDKEGEINKLVETYKKELLIDRYKQAVLQQELDTNITNEDIDIHYKRNKEIYKLNESLIQLQYIHYNKEINDEKELIKLFKSNSKEDVNELISNELEYNSFNFNDSIWVNLNEVIKKLPVLKEVRNIKKNDFIKKEDSLGVYLVSVKDILKRKEIAPKSYVVPTIKQMILHKRKLELMKKVEKTLIIDAINKKQFEQY